MMRQKQQRFVDILKTDDGQLTTISTTAQNCCLHVLLFPITPMIGRLSTFGGQT